jgi:hypothetical protein
MYCTGGFCTALVVNGAACKSETDCNMGSSCVGGFCAQYYTGAAKSACTMSSQCASNFCNSANLCSSGTPATSGVVNHSCTVNTDCPSMAFNGAAGTPVTVDA